MKKTDNIQRGILKGLKNCLWKTKFFSCKRGSSNLSIDKIKSLACWRKCSLACLENVLSISYFKYQ